MREKLWRKFGVTKQTLLLVSQGFSLPQNKRCLKQLLGRKPKSFVCGQNLEEVDEKLKDWEETEEYVANWPMAQIW